MLIYLSRLLIPTVYMQQSNKHQNGGFNMQPTLHQLWAPGSIIKHTLSTSRRDKPH